MIDILQRLRVTKEAALPAWAGRRRRADLLTALLFLAPSLLIFGVFVYYALAFNLYLSATSWDFLSPTKAFTGLRNYFEMFGDHRFWNVVRNTCGYTLGSVALAMAFGLPLALLLSRKLPGRGILRTVLFAPYITTTAAVALVWVWIFDPTYGLVNFGLRWLGFIAPRWLSDPHWAMFALIIMNTWRTTGYTMVLFLGGLTAIPRSLYEAAEIDGASAWSTFWHITLPLLSPTTYFVLLTSTFAAFQVFDQVAVMTAGGPVDATTVFNFYIYQQAFGLFRAGYAAAAATVLFLILLLLTLLQTRVSQRWVHYQ